MFRTSYKNILLIHISISFALLIVFLFTDAICFVCSKMFADAQYLLSISYIYFPLLDSDFVFKTVRWH